ncbi:hypothetical protein MRX96_042668 [Rhipicephalus microplus]
MASMQKRLQKELLSMQKEPPPGVNVDIDNVGSNLTQWIVDMEGAKGTLYEGEKFQLLFKFSSKYPFDSPEVTFLGPNIPVHPHVYSNGHICLSNPDRRLVARPVRAVRLPQHHLHAVQLQGEATTRQLTLCKDMQQKPQEDQVVVP